MARRQVIVQLDDGLVERLDGVAGNEGVSRSALIRRAVSELLERRWIAEEDRKMIEGYRTFPPDADLAESSGRLAAETVPPW